MLGVLFYKLGAFFSHRLPNRLSEAITETLAQIQYYIRFGSRRNALENLRIVMGPKTNELEIQRRGKNLFSNFGRSIYCFLRVPYLPPGELRRRCDFRGIDDVARRLLADGGFILAGPHVGPWEIAGACLCDIGIPIHTVTLPHPSRRVTEFFDDRRRLMGIQCYPIGGSFLSLRRALQDGKCVALLIDREYGRVRGMQKMFGCDVALPRGHAALAVRCEVPILTAALVFDDGCGFKFVYGEPHYPDGSLDERMAIEKLQRECQADMERFIGEYPDQWFNFEPLRGSPV
ncbi:MAG: lysophospholipid acyltransferase family protein [Candidatus Latescibacterota bacterium]|nr:MAG: lysophospholipid acyltransferase family protein [Candidatus Latescibacterota bacterium]